MLEELGGRTLTARGETDMTETVLVTGGSGYIAAFCIADLLRQGFNVRTTVRSLGREADVRASLARLVPSTEQLTFVAADLNTDAGWAEAVSGCTYVMHVASPLPTTDPKHDDELVKPARDGALRVLRAARDVGVKRVVMTASTACIAYGHGSRQTPFTEADWTDETNRADTSAYERSKTIAERAARAWLAAEGGALELVTVHPGAVLGPVLGRDFSGSIEIVKKLMDGSLPGIPRFGFPMVDVRDIADLHMRAMLTDGIAGERFIGAGDFTWMADVARVLRDRLGARGRKVPTMNIPDFVLRVISLFDPLVRGRLFELGKQRPVTAEKARRMLGWVQRPDADSIVDTAESLIAEGIV
jgi:dihydroflavonol-4-reductase